MRLGRIAGALATAALLAGGASAHASAITTNQWYYFHFNETGSALGASNASSYASGPIIGQDLSDGTWTITLSNSAELFWTDLQISGDRFEFYDGSTLLGSTGPDVANASSVGTDISAALADSNYGKGSVLLGPGSYSLNGLFLGEIQYGDGAFIIRDRNVPAPATGAVLGLALAGLALARRRRS